MVQVRQRREVLPHHQRFPERKKASTSEPSKPPTPKSKDVPIGSIPDFKRVEEIWDKATSKFKTREAVVEKGIDELDQYAFVVRTRTDMPSLKQSVTVRVNSDFIRKALRHVMGVAKAIGLQEDKPIIDQKLLYNFLPDLKRYEAKAAGAFEDELKHISLFVNFIAHTYQPVTQQLLPQLKAGQIAWDLLGTVMKPGYIWFDLDELENKQRMEEKEQFRRADADDSSMTDDDYLICCPSIPAFSFSDNAFYEVVVDDTRNIEWSPSLFKSLTSSDDQKLLLMALMRTQLGIVPSLPFDDFVTGKGKGLNVLLLGPPGVGKTLTAEAMSEHFQRPLHSISAAQLAVEPDRLEDNLTHIFQIAKRFDALLLLDKADVFLERRASINASKDATVTIFLRKLEYFQGIFFLTTNRDAELDEAILSRIHLKLKYEALNQRQRKDMWARFATRARTHQGPVMVSDTDLDRLAILDLNGREVSLYCNHLVQVLPLRQRARSKT
ncbi:hypothetical protein LOZ64_002014 [Ophidiomyces ophidiicola]|nr:hypothetical protein LOZ64_002014 [Ophidiomyces ophidiicola]KAI2007177.1 hypothetical protein LOZ49_004739 [Ophidiomyces ophidiicola]KAI2140842.1 hypothetical protein LOZ28_002735 [Ophidiomyces ophidiicola]KAI2439837.1 hypothetical protein LOZ08_004307 [Ophidiomyces ophidiicola]KAI2456065.1 hypothetical protein LOY86_001456 [Ophidiomyces ophidiicola]